MLNTVSVHLPVNPYNKVYTTAVTANGSFVSRQIDADIVFTTGINGEQISIKNTLTKLIADVQRLEQNMVACACMEAKYPELAELGNKYRKLLSENIGIESMVDIIKNG